MAMLLLPTVPELINMSEISLPEGVTPTVAIIGRPNVGKSTLFNRLVGRRQSIVHDQPGVTRDRIVGTAVTEDDRAFDLIDTGGLVPGDDPLGLGDQVFLAIDESDLLLLVVDGRDGLVAADERVWESVRRRGKATILVVNKSDTNAAQEQFGEFYGLGVESQVLISAEHGRGISELWKMLGDALPRAVPANDADDLPSIAIVGRPNVGKSSLLNRLIGETRVLVSPVAGTTRDPIDTVFEWQGQKYRFVDTAGIRRRSQVTGEAEDLAVMFARRQMERARIVVLLIDASRGLTTGDLAIAGTAWEMGRAVVVVVNKWDLLSEELREQLDLDWPRLDGLLCGPSRVNLSALTGRHIDKVMPVVVSTLERYNFELGTSDVNRVFELAVARHQAAQHHGRPWRMYYATQVSTGPPTMMLFANRTLKRGDSYRRYLENRLRDSYDLSGIPVRLVIRKRT